MKTYRVYGEPKRIANKYYEVEYTEYREDGTICNVGTEDFSFERLQMLKTYEVLAKIGKTKESSTHVSGRNRWGHLAWYNVFERKTAVFVANNNFKEHEIQLRKL